MFMWATSGERAAVRKGLTFRVSMAGTVAFGDSDAFVAAQLGDAYGNEMTLRLKVEIDDVDAFLADRQHRTVVSGSIDCEILGGVLPVESGSVTLLPENGTGRATAMEYRLDFADRLTGRELTLLGIRTVRNDPGFDLWRDITTLDVQLFPRQHHLTGSRPEGMPVLSGQLRLSLLSFLRQLTTFHATATTPLGRAQTVLAFGGFCLRRLVEVYLRAPGRREQRLGVHRVAAHGAADGREGVRPQRAHRPGGTGAGVGPAGDRSGLVRVLCQRALRRAGGSTAAPPAARQRLPVGHLRPAPHQRGGPLSPPPPDRLALVLPMVGHRSARIPHLVARTSRARYPDRHRGDPAGHPAGSGAPDHAAAALARA